MYAARTVAVSADKRYTKSGLELKYYEEDEWNKLSNQQRTEIRKAKQDKGFCHTKEEVKKLKAAKKKSDSNDSSKAGSASYSGKRGAGEVKLVNGKAYGFCKHCGLTDHTSGDACQVGQVPEDGECVQAWKGPCAYCCHQRARGQAAPS